MATKATKKTNPNKKTKSILTNDSIKFFEELSNTPSPTGFEYTGQKIWLDYIKPFVDSTFVDPYGTAVAVINPDAKYKVVIEAHADEISWFVNYIDDKGFIYVIRNWGSDHMIAPSKRVIIHTESGKKLPAVFGWPAIHTRGRGKEDPAPKLDNISLDCGATSKDEVLEMWINVWDVITYPDKFAELNERYFMGRAMDNRAWGFMISQVARLLKENKKKLPFGLYIVNSVQEEIGLKWAHMIAHRLKPDVAIVTDVCHDTSTPMINVKKEGDTRCGLGPTLTVGPAVHNNLLKLLRDTARTNKIPFQMLAASTYTGTDTDAFAYSNEWVPSALISMPVRYMHTTVEMIHRDDVENAIKLMYETVLKIKDGQKFDYVH